MTAAQTLPDIPGRRRFMASGFAALAGLAAAPRASRPAGRPLRALGRTGLRTPRLSLGCAQANDPGLILAALDEGIVHFDTAGHYGNGTNERLLGRALKGRPRESIIVATKVLPDGEDQGTGLFTERTTAAAFLAKFEKSLQRLGLEHVDILYLHQACRREAVLFEPLLRALESIRASGKARFIGVSTHQREPEVIDAAAESGRYDLVLTSYNFRQPHASQVREAIARAAGRGLGIVAMKVLAGVYWDASRTRPIDPVAAMKWVLADPYVDTALLGCSTLEQVRTMAAVLENPELTELDLSRLRGDGGAGHAGLYCAQCSACRDQCAAHLDIPTWMRGYMYAYGYRTASRAKQILPPDSPPPACLACGSCRVRCRMGFDVRRRILDLARLREIPDVFLA